MPDRILDFEEWEVVRANFPNLPSYHQYMKIGEMVKRCWREKYKTDVWKFCLRSRDFFFLNFQFGEIENFFVLFESRSCFVLQFLSLNSKVTRDFYWYFLKWLMKSPTINSGKTVGTYCSKARKYIEYAKGYRFDDKIVNQRTYEIIRNSYCVGCVLHFFGFC